MKIKAAVYARFSSHNQREESIDQQLRVCHKWADDNGYQIVKEYTDSALSGTTDKRPGFQQMIYESEKKNFDVLLVYSHDRFARNRYDAATYKAKLKKNGVRVIAVTMPLDDSPESTLMESVMEGFAEYYSKDLARKVTRGMDDNALNCKSNGGIPLGYKVDEAGAIVLDPAGAKAIQLIFDRYDAGKTKKEIVDELAEKGMKSKHGKPISYNSLYKILENERYCGIYTFKETRIPDGIPRIIPQDQFDRVQEKIKNRKIRKKKGPMDAMDFLLTGKVFCGNCGQSMIGDSGTGKSGQKYYYYSCSKKKHKGAKACTKGNERKEDLENFVVNYICENVLTDENIKAIAARAFALLDEEYQDKSLLNQYQAELKECVQKIDNILKAVEAGMFNPSMTERLTKLEQQQSDLECKIVSEQLKKPEFSQDHIEFYLQSFKGGNIQDTEYVKGMIDALVNSVFVFDADEKKGNDAKIIIALNLKNTPTKVLTCSDVHKMVDHITCYPNTVTQKYLVIFIF